MASFGCVNGLLTGRRISRQTAADADGEITNRIDTRETGRRLWKWTWLHDKKRGAMPTPEQAKAIERYAAEVWGQGRLAVLEDIVTRDCVRHGPDIEGGGYQGVQGHKDLVMLYRTAFPDLKIPVETMASIGDVVLTRWNASGTNTGSMLGAAPTGKSFVVFGFWLHRFEGDQIAEEWAAWDTLGFMRQLGL